MTGCLHHAGPQPGLGAFLIHSTSPMECFPRRLVLRGFFFGYWRPAHHKATQIISVFAPPPSPLLNFSRLSRGGSGQRTTRRPWSTCRYRELSYLNFVRV